MIEEEERQVDWACNAEKQKIFDLSKDAIILMFAGRLEKLYTDHARIYNELETEQIQAIDRLHVNVFGRTVNDRD